MSLLPGQAQLIAFGSLAEVVAKEARHLEQTQLRLFVEPIDAAWVLALETNEDLAERVEAFVSRFGRLQDTIGEKLLPRMAALAGQRPVSQIELLASAEKLGWIESAEAWLAWRKLRNRLVHEYVTDPLEFALALRQAGQAAIDLLASENRIRGEAQRLGFLP